MISKFETSKGASQVPNGDLDETPSWIVKLGSQRALLGFIYEREFRRITSRTPSLSF